MLGRVGFAAIAVISAVIGASTLNPRELYNEMYPVEAVKRDAFHICHEAYPTFVRAVKADREACFEAMPHAIAVALGRVRPGAAQTVAALLDPAHQAELLLTLAAMPPRQPVTVPRSFHQYRLDAGFVPRLRRQDRHDGGSSGPPSASGNARTAASTAQFAAIFRHWRAPPAPA